MSGEFRRHMEENKRIFLSEEHTKVDESIYQAWITTKLHGKPADKLMLIPDLSDENTEIWRIPYLQTIVQRYRPQKEELCLMFPSSGLLVFIEGRELYDLDELIEKRQVHTIMVFDENVHQPIGNDVPVITKITVETSS